MEGLFRKNELSYIKRELLKEFDPDKISFRFRHHYAEYRYKNKPFYIAYPVFTNKEFLKKLSLDYKNKIENIDHARLQKSLPNQDFTVMVQIAPDVFNHYRIENSKLISEVSHYIHEDAVKYFTVFFNNLKDF
jgi:hypothetical protein